MTNCVKTRLTVVDSAFRRKSHDDVLIQERRVIGRSLDVIAPGKYFPRSDTDKSLSRGRCKRVFKPFVLRCSGARGDQLCVEVPVCFQSVQRTTPKDICKLSGLLSASGGF